MSLEDFVPKWVDTLSEWVAAKTAAFTKTKVGNVFLAMMVLGPLTLIPTVWEAWTAENIEALRTATWPAMAVIDFSFYLNVCHAGDRMVRATVLLYLIMAILIYVATLVR
jgi:hypothetical protein